MDRFKPSRVSPPVSRLNRILQESSDVSSSLELLANELAELTAAEIDLIDAIISRAGPSATTFLTIFKAYNEVLEERGLSDANETVCYGKLLKLGTLKGRTWAEKWDKVKAQRPLVSSRAPLQPSSISNAPLAAHRFESVSDIFNPSEIESTTDFAESTPRLNVRHSRSSRHIPPPPVHLPKRRTEPKNNRTRSYLTSDAESTTTHIPPPKPKLPAATTAKAMPPIRQPRSAEVSKPSRVSEDEAWKRIQMERDEENAELYYQDRLMERFWTMWKQGYEWIDTTGQQVSEARDRLSLEQHFQRWREKHTLQRRLSQQAEQFVLSSSLKRWSCKLEEARLRRRRHQVRQEMRQSMHIVRERWQARIVRDAWKRWRQAVRLVVLSDRYNQLVTRRSYVAWRERHLRIGDANAHADELFHEHQMKSLVTTWQRWRHSAELRTLETTMRTRVELRIMDNALTSWRKHLRSHAFAEQVYEQALKRLTIRRWRNAMRSIEAMERRADRQLSKSDGVFLYALLKIWKDKKNGQAFERKRLRNCKINGWIAWKDKLQQHESNYALAVQFHERPGSAVVKDCVGQWRYAYNDVQQILRMADAVSNGHTAARFLNIWRKRLRSKLKMIKMARAASKYFLTKQVYLKWREQAAEKHRERLLQAYMTQVQMKKFQVWLQKTRVKRSRAAALQTMLTLSNQRTMHNALSRWVQRTVEIKEREFQITQQTKMVLVISTFDKWKKFYKRKCEQKSLLENYNLVRQEELTHRLFARWATLTRMARSRREVLQEAEDELRLRALSKFWEVWRERRLKGAEDEFLLRWNARVVRNHFAKWNSKTKTLPAIQFQAVRMKCRYIGLWKTAMSRAVLAKEARNFHRTRSLETAFSKWLEEFKVKKMRKAIARARHLRLPTAAPKPLPPATNNYPRRNFLAVPGKKIEESGESSPIAAHSTISSTYIGGPSAASISMKSASPRIHLGALSRDRSPFRSGEGSSLARARSENGDPVAPSVRKAPSSVTSMDAPVSRRAWPDLSRKPRLYLAPKTS